MATDTLSDAFQNVIHITLVTSYTLGRGSEKLRSYVATDALPVVLALEPSSAFTV